MAKKKMRLVVLESPYAGEVPRNVAYARACVHDCLLRGEAAIASHLFYAQLGITDDTVPEERAMGIEAGLQWASLAEASVIYTDYGMSRGMTAAVERAQKEGRPVEYRILPKKEWDRLDRGDYWQDGEKASWKG